jgi:acyl-CoA thioesterase I
MSVALFMKLFALAVAGLVLLYIISLILIGTSLARYKKYWEEQNRQPISENATLYVALGDSTAQGIGASSPGKGYPGLIAHELNKRKPVQLINLSKSGAKVSDALTEQLPKLKDLPVNEKTIITVEIGANDMTGFNAENFERDMDQFMAELPKQALISDIPYFGGSRLNKLQPNVERANAIMYRLAEKHGFTLVPLHDKMRQNSGLKTLATDLFHPSNTAYKENWAPAFLERIE